MSPETRDAAAEMLPLPRASSLTQAQIDGTACVWCKAPDGLIALGPRVRPVAGELRRWHPRACRPCAGRKAVSVYRLHISTCARCSHRNYCPDSQALHALALEYWPPSRPSAPAPGETT